MSSIYHRGRKFSSFSLLSWKAQKLTVPALWSQLFPIRSHLEKNHSCKYFKIIIVLWRGGAKGGLSLVFTFLLMLLYHSDIFRYLGKNKFKKKTPHVEACSVSHQHWNPPQNKPAIWNVALAVHASIYQNRANPSQKCLSEVPPNTDPSQSQIPVSNNRNQEKCPGNRAGKGRIDELKWQDWRLLFWFFFIGQSHDA